MTALLETVEVVTGSDPEVTVIWLHGLGAEGHEFEPIVPALRLERSVRFVFPRAPARTLTARPDMVVRAWYDILVLDIVSVEDETGIRATQAMLSELVEREIARGISANRIVLAGFSQGGAIALYTGLRFPRRLAGILVLSAYLPLSAALAEERSAANAETPILMAHGNDDPVLPEALAVDSRRSLEALGYGVDWRSYPMGHMICGDEVRDVSRWLNARLEALVR